MALAQTLAAVNAVIADAVPQAFGQGFTQITHLFDLLPHDPPSDPKGPRWSVGLTANASIRSGAEEGSEMSAPGAVVTGELSLGWGKYDGSVQFSELQMKELELAAAMGLQRVADYLGMQIQSLVDGLKAAMETDIIGSSTSTDRINGLALINDNNTYAGLSRVTYAALQCYTKDNSGGGNVSLTAALMDDVANYADYTIGFDQPGPLGRAWLVGVAVSNAINALSTGAVTTTAAIASGPITKYIGFQNRVHNSGGRPIPILTVPNYTANRMDLMNLDAARIEIMGITVHPMQFEYTNRTYIVPVSAYAQLKQLNPRKNFASLQELTP